MATWKVSISFLKTNMKYESTFGDRHNARRVIEDACNRGIWIESKSNDKLYFFSAASIMYASLELVDESDTG